MMPQYANLNTKSHFSCGLGIGTSKEIIQSAQKKGLSAIALTDSCTAGGLLDFYNKGKELKFPVILGAELYVHHNTELHRLILLAKNQNGYTNICKLITASTINKESYGKPACSLYDLSDCKDDLFCITNSWTIKEYVENIFQQNLFWEIILETQYENVNKLIIQHCDQYVITSDAYIPEENQKILQDIMITNTAFGYSKEPFSTAKYIMSLEDIVKKVVSSHKYLDISYLKEAIDNTNKIAQICSKIELKFKDQIINYPHLLHPLNHDSCDKETLLRRIIDSYGRFPKDNPQYVERLEYEIQTIRNNGRVDLIDYFLVLEDLCRWCRENKIAVGPGRGSGAGSLVNYCLKVTHLDPIKYGLLFERFISAGRIQKGTLPDVDIDFSEQEPVRQYLISMYGEDRVIPIGTYQTLKAKGSIKDIFRAFYPDLHFQYVQNICNQFGMKEQEETELEYFERGLENPVVLEAFKKHSNIEENVRRLLGYNRQPGIHPCGLAITQDPLKDLTPLRYNKEHWVIELSAGDCEKSGIIKYDILGLKTLNYIQKCLELTGLTDLYAIPLDDEKTFKAFVAGDTTSVFQFNSDVSKNILMQLPLNKMSLDTLSMVTSVGRPGPMKNNQHNEFIKRVKGRSSVAAPHPALEDTLKDTYGIMIYQESVMKASQILGGFSLAEADDVRKAMGKKNAKVLAPYKQKFIDHCKAHFPDTQREYFDENKKWDSHAEYIWELMATFSGYGFNKSHSMSYALIGYYCQYLKVNYPIEWWTACMTYADKDQLKTFYQDCSMHTINPDINNSTSEFYITADRKIQMPFSCIKGLGEKASEEISKMRPFSNFEDFFNRVNKTRVNKAVVEKLIFCGCFDSFGVSQQDLIAQYYSLRGEKIPEAYINITKNLIEENRSKALSFLSMDYYKIYPAFFPENEMVYYEKLEPGCADKSVGGIIVAIKKKTTKNKSQYCDVIIANDSEEMSVRMWSDSYSFYENKMAEKQIVRFIGKTSTYMDKVQFTATGMLFMTKEK